jgi:hypothetical protein
VRAELRELGLELGRSAWGLFPGGVLVHERDFEAARARSRELLAGGGAEPLFEAAFEHQGVAIRTDVIESLPGRRLGLREVKAGTSVRDEYLDDAVLQLYVLRGAGYEVGSVELVLVNPSYARPPGPVDWSAFFARHDVSEDAEFLLSDVASRLAEQEEVLAGGEPAIEPSPHCRVPGLCEFWDSCTRGLPRDRIDRLPGLKLPHFHALRELGVGRIQEVPHDFTLNPRQRRAIVAQRQQGSVVEPTLRDALAPAGPPSAYLDFETVSPPLPLFVGMKPYQPVAYQWSLHQQDATGHTTHAAFLATRPGDPRRDFARELVAALADSSAPILVYSGYEERILRELAEALPDLEAGILRVVDHLFDLLPVIRDHIYHPAFAGSFSMKAVAPALVPDFSYSDLEGIQEGGAAASAIAELITGQATPARAARLRASLLAYCQRDTEALLSLHHRLRELAG